MRNSNAQRVVQGAAIAAIYVLLTLVSSAFGLANGAVQIRISEALTILPVFTPVAIPGLTVGCLLSNLLTGCAPWDVVFGTLATLLGALGTRKLRHNLYLAAAAPVVSNTLIIPWILSLVYHIPNSIPYFMLTVGAGEIVSCVVLGLLLHSLLKKHEHRLF